MKRIPDAMLAKMAGQLSDEDRDEMAIPSYRHPNPALRWMAWRRVEAVADRIARLYGDGRTDRTVVDFGCGTGVLFETALRGAKRLVGVDLVLDSARMLAAEWKLEVELMSPQQAEQSIEPGSVDLVIAAEVLEHVEPPEEAIGAFKSWLRPGGTLLVSLPTENALYRLGRRLAGFEGHYHHDNAESIDRAIRKMGFVRRARSFIPLPGPLAIYWVAEYERPA